MASVWGPKQLPSGAWRIRWRAPDGSQPSKTYDAKSDASRAVRDLERKIGPTLRRKRRALGPQPPTFLSIETIADRWRETREGTAVATRPGADRYMSDAVRMACGMAEDLGWSTSRDANAPDVADLKRRRKNIGIARPLGYLRAILRWASENAEQPLDVAADVAMRAPQSRKAAVELLTDREAKAVLNRARRLQQLPVIACLATYGWRPITACRLRVGDVDLKAETIRISIKQNGEPWTHPLFAFHVELLRPLVAARGPAEPLFLNTHGKVGWTNGKLGGFYRHCLRPDGGRTGNIYALKRLAMTRMHLGLWPWSEPLSISDIQLFTGHKTKEQVLRYLATNLTRARGLVRGADRGAIGAPDGQEPPSVAVAALRKSMASLNEPSKATSGQARK